MRERMRLILSRTEGGTARDIGGEKKKKNEQGRCRLKRDLGLERPESEAQSVQGCRDPYGRKVSSEREIEQKLAHM